MSHVTRLNVDDSGTGHVPLIFLHSYAGSAHQWSPQLARFRESMRAIAFDLPANGWSAAPIDNDYSIAAFADTLAFVVDSLNLTQVVLVGHSLGAAAAIAYAGAHPDRVAGLIVEEAPGKLPESEVAKIRQSLDANYGATMEQIWERLLANAKPMTRKQVLRDRDRVSESASREIIKATFAYDPVPDLRRYHGPILSIISEHGDIPTALHNVALQVPHARIDGTSHWVHMDRPRAFNELMTEFLVSLPVVSLL